MSSSCSDFAQRMSTTLERESARAILRRPAPVGSHDTGCNAADWIDDPMEQDDAGDVVMSSFQYVCL